MITLEPPRGFAADDDPWASLGLSQVSLSRFLRKARLAVGLSGEVDVLITGDTKIRQLNRSFRGKDKATDVLSFPAIKELAGHHAGDLAISYETAARQAADHDHKLSDEVRVLMLHGLLHLHGMDHETDGGEMASREADLQKRLRLPAGLIARAEGSQAENDRRRRPKKQFPYGNDNQKSKTASVATDSKMKRGSCV